jgi:hypothetical protein
MGGLQKKIEFVLVDSARGYSDIKKIDFFLAEATPS